MKARPSIQRQKSSTPVAAAQKDLRSPLAAFIIAIILAAAVFAIYSPALNFQFILDDHHFLNDPRLQSSGHVSEYFTKYVWAQNAGGPASFYRPFFVLWLRLSFILSDLSSRGWHLLSVTKHVLVAFLLGLLVWKLLRDRVAALIAGTLFALHPAQTESVAWVTVPDPVMSAAVLGTLLLYLNYAEHSPDTARDSPKFRKRNVVNSRASTSNWWLMLSAITCLAALMAKETAIVLPAIIFVMVLFVPLNKSEAANARNYRNSELKDRVLSALSETMPFLIATAIYLICRWRALNGTITASTQHLYWHTVMLSWPATLWFYGKVMLWPVRSRAFADSNLADHFSGNVFFTGLGVFVAFVILVWACVWAWRKAQRDLSPREANGVKRALVLGVSILVLPILPALNLNALNSGDFLHGRYTYLPLAGLMILLAIAWHLVRKNRTLLLASLGLIAVAFSVLTIKQEGEWKDDLTVFTVAHQNAPHNGPVAQSLSRAHVQVALGLDETGQCGEAVPIFQQAIQQYPHDWFAWAGLGECYFKLNDLAKGEQAMHRAAELSGEPRVKEEWQEMREKMGLSPAP